MHPAVLYLVVAISATLCCCIVVMTIMLLREKKSIANEEPNDMDKVKSGSASYSFSQQQPPNPTPRKGEKSPSMNALGIDLEPVEIRKLTTSPEPTPPPRKSESHLDVNQDQYRQRLTQSVIEMHHISRSRSSNSFNGRRSTSNLLPVGMPTHAHRHSHLSIHSQSSNSRSQSNAHSNYYARHRRTPTPNSLIPWPINIGPPSMLPPPPPRSPRNQLNNIQVRNGSGSVSSSDSGLYESGEELFEHIPNCNTPLESHGSSMTPRGETPSVDPPIEEQVLSFDPDKIMADVSYILNTSEGDNVAVHRRVFIQESEVQAGGSALGTPSSEYYVD